MNGIDITIVVCSGALLIWGLVKGLTRMVMAIIAIFVGLILATRGYDVVGGWFQSIVSSRSLAMMIGFIFAFMCVIVVFTLLANVMKKALDAVNLGCLDHVLGGMLGLTAGVLVSSIIIIALALFSPEREQILKKSILAPYVIEFSSVVVKLVPQDLREDFLKKYYDIKRHAEGEAKASLLSHQYLEQNT